MRHSIIVLSAAALIVAASPLAAQDSVPPPSVPAPSAATQPQAETPARPTGETAGEPSKGADEKGRVEKPPQEKAAKKKADDWGFRFTDHPSLRLGPGTRIDFRVRFQGDLDETDASLPGGDGGHGGNDVGSNLDVARRRVGVEGEIANVVGYQVEGEIGDDHSPWRDVYANYKQFAFAEVQAGHFKMPFSLDENTSATNLDFVYRSRAAALLAPGRDWGVMVHGRVLRRGWLRYELGLFREDGDNARTFDTDRVHGGQTLAGRAVVQPFRGSSSLARDLSFGVSFTSSEVPEGISDLRGRTELGESFYRPAVFVNGARRRVGFEARFRPGPFSVKSEYIRLSDERLGQGVDDSDLEPFVSSGWYVSGTWALTGESKADGLDSPRRPLFRGGFGAVELAVRVERIRFGASTFDPLATEAPRSDVVFGNSDGVYTFGVNWYANRWIKIQANLVRNTIALPELGPSPGQPGYWSRLIRFQFSM
jgi:phosphate-selective porin OprO/OprP